MAIKNHNKISALDGGSTNNVTCPCCNELVSMRLFTTKDTTLVAKIKGEDKNIYISVCPNCASVFSVNTNYLKERERGTYVLLTEGDLKLISNNNG
ncbi:MAG: hypothetical protein IJN88_04680 [Clostridia bacterium]|nr:hypothetical protein [Clostridia bacterium]